VAHAQLLEGAEIGRIEVLGQPQQIVLETISKITRAKWTGGMAQVVEHLLCKNFLQIPSLRKDLMDLQIPSLRKDLMELM
jgi:hypothetical protein